MVVPRFVAQALSGEPVTVYGDGNNTRCFTHVTDAVGALIGLMEKDSAVGQVFNVGSTEEIRILDLAERVMAMTESRSEVTFIPYAVAYEENFEDMPRRVPALEKIRDTIGWAPTIDLTGILESVIEFQQSRRLVTV